MKNVLVVATSLVGLGTAASAGGLAAPVVEPVVVVATYAPVASWEGAYLGGNLNYGKGKLKANGELADELSEFGLGKTLSKPNGTSFAIRGGYDWQFGQVVAGLGVEYNLGHYKKGQHDIGDEISVDSIKLKNVGTLFGRVGYAFDQNWMGYGLLGYSWGKVEAQDSDDGSKSKNNLNGTTIGLGLAYKIDDNWSAYGEYAYTNFGKVKDTDGDLKATLQQVKLGVNYRF